MNIVLNSKPVDALSIILHRSQAEPVGRDWVKRLKGLLSRQLFEIVIQASVGNKIIAREGLSAMRKNVTAKCYGGDVSRKMKLLNKQVCFCLFFFVECSVFFLWGFLLLLLRRLLTCYPLLPSSPVFFHKL
jgi:hypothetical protein